MLGIVRTSDCAQCGRLRKPTPLDSRHNPAQSTCFIRETSDCRGRGGSPPGTGNQGEEHNLASIFGPKIGV